MWEAERRYSWRKREGAIRVLGYDNRAQAGNYGEALKLAAETGTTPNVSLTDRVGTLKYGTGISFDQAITSDVGVFTRLGWNDGKTQSFAFTAIDRLASGGVSIKGHALAPEIRRGGHLVHGRWPVRRSSRVSGRRADSIF